jgi:hypothetical protein
MAKGKSDGGRAIRITKGKYENSQKFINVVTKNLTNLNKIFLCDIKTKNDITKPIFCSICYKPIHPFQLINNKTIICCHNKKRHTFMLNTKVLDSVEIMKLDKYTKLVKKEGLDKEILESRNRLFSDLYGK